MSGTGRPVENGDERGLVVHVAGDPQQVKYLGLVLSYLYGLNVVVVRSLAEASQLLLERSDGVRCVFVVHSQRLTSQTAIQALSLRGRIPVFLISPGEHVLAHRVLCEGLRNVFFFAWEDIPTSRSQSLREVIDDAFERNDIGGLFDGARHLSYRALQQRVHRRLQRLTTLPTLPAVVTRAMQVLGDPESTNEQIEEILLSDPAVVHKLLQVVGSPLFAGSGQRERWSLADAIVRLGRRRLGSIALQIKLINSLICPEDSRFDLPRFWTHSVGTAMVAERLVQGRLLPWQALEECTEYWTAALLHDIGKLTLGFFFWSYFQRLQAMVADGHITFRQAEDQLGNPATHEQVGMLLLIRSGLGREVVAAVGRHHDTNGPWEPLTCLVHLANNLCKELGHSHLPGEAAAYCPTVLAQMGVDAAALEQLRADLRQTVEPQLGDLLHRCLG